ncbi:MAG: YkuS family protein [Caldicoprobacterales bacterium]|nr:YkuS family protein [Clostridiales bacterium]
MKHIAVQEGLTPVINYLIRSGYKVSEFSTRQKASKDFLDGFDAVVMTGLDDNFMGIQTSNSNRPIIEARGMTPEDVKAAIEQRVQ